MAPFKQTALVIVLSAVYAHAGAQTVAPTQLPTGGKVVAGQASIQQSGSALNINQSSARAAVDWNTFNVGKDAQVNFNQPSSSAVTLNRVLDTNASQIMGRITAPGQVFLVNPNGVLFGPGSQVDVGGLIATTQNISNADFMAGKSTFEGNGRSGASVVNQGQLQAKLGGYIALLAPSVRNEGVIIAHEGTVALAAGDKSVVEFSGGARVVSVLVDRAIMDALVENRQIIRADGGLVVLSARSANAILSSVITQSGTVQANTVVNKNGRIVLEGGEQGVVHVSGTLQAAGVDTGTQGGNLVVTGDKVQIASGAILDGSGKAGGGNVLVGGGWQGQDPNIRQANAVVVESGSRLDASATDQGTGGTVVAWSNTTNASSVTRVSGEMLARGGANGGDGGRIETSGHWLSTVGVKGDASAPRGKGGQWLFDPYDITISSAATNSTPGGTGVWTATSSGSVVNNADINNLLNQGTNVTLSTDRSTSGTDGNITVDAPITGSGVGGAAKLTLTADHNITVNQAISVAGSGSMVQLNAGNTASGGNVAFGAAVNVDTLSVNMTGNSTVTQTAAITTNNLKLTGTANDVILNNAANKVGTIAANVKSLSLVNDTGVDRSDPYGNGMYVGTVDGLNGITATGAVNIAMNNGNIFLEKNISTTSTASNALVLNAGANLAPSAVAGAGINPFGPNIVRLGSSTLSVGSGGRGTLYTGSVDGGSVALATYVGTGTGRFRYFSDETTTNYTTALQAGMNMVFRQQPKLAVSSNTTQTYGLTSTISSAFSGYLNGDTLATSVNNPTGLTVSIAGPTSTAGYYTAGDHALTVSGATSSLGYGFNYLASNLTVNKRGLTIVATPASKVYDSLTAATTQLTSNKFDADLVEVSSTSSVFADKNVGTGKTVTVSGLALSSGADAGNYFITNAGGVATASTGSITARAITGVYTAQNKMYDGTTTATVNGTSTGILAGDTVTFVNSVATFVNKDANAAGTQVNMTGISLGGADGANYSVANPTATLSAVIAPKDITVTFTGSAKTYDGLSTATVTGGTSYFAGGDAPTYSGVVANFVDKNAATSKLINISGYSLTGTGAGNYRILNSTATTTADLNKKALTMAGLTATDKVYDGNTTATLNTSAVTLTGKLAGDDLTLNATGAFSDKNVGTTKSVTITSNYSGADAGNYSYSNQASTTANITARSLAVTAVGTDKAYDGTRTATYTLSSNQVAGDTLTLQGSSGLFDSKDVSTSNNGVQNVTVGGITLTGTDAANYNLQNTTTTTTAKIVPKGLTATVSANNKVYDGDNTATATLSNLQGFVGQETVTATANSATFNSNNVGTANTVTVNTVTLANGNNGGLASNYTIATGQTAAAQITAKALTATATANNKAYDGTTAATTTLTFNGLVGSETLNSTRTASFDNKNVGTGKTVTVNSIALTDGANGGLASNYSINAGQTTTADVTPKVLTATATAVNKVYDGNTAAAATLTVNGLVGSETLAVTNAATFNSKDVTAANTVTVNTVTLANGTNGGLASNYSLAAGQTASANITPKALTASATASDKAYDGNTTASAQVSLAGMVSSEQLGTTVAATFNSKDVLTANTVTVNSIALSNGGNGGLASNYSVGTGQTASASITPKVLTAALVANDKTYDATTTATGSLTVSGLVGSETLGVTHQESFVNKNAGANKTVTVNSVQLADGTNDGKASNYALAAGQTDSADINAKVISAMYRGVDKVYDGTTAASVVGSANGVIAGDSVQFSQNPTAFSDKNAGTSKSIVVNGIAISGADAANYSLLSTTAGATATITPKALTATVTAEDKWYDGTTAAKATLSNLQGFVGNETVSLTGNTASFNSANPQDAHTVTVSAVNYVNGANGGLASNYTIAPGQTAPAIIRAQPTGCIGSCNAASSSTAPSITPLAQTIYKDASLVAGVNAGAIKRSFGDVPFQVPVATRPVSPVPVTSVTALLPVTALTTADAAQVRGLSGSQVAALSASKVAELMTVLTPSQLAAITPDQMSGMDAVQLNTLVRLMDSAMKAKR